MRLDAHQHFWRYDPGRDGWITNEMAVLQRDFLPEDLLPQLAAHHLDSSIAVQADQSETETRRLLELAEAYPVSKGVVGWVDLRAPDCAARLEYFSRFERLCGFRHIAQAEPDDFLARADFLRGIGRLQEFGFTYDILIYPRQLAAALQLVERCPGQPFVIDHLAKPLIKERQLAPWAQLMREIAAHPHVYCKVSGLITEADWRAWQPVDFQPYLDVAFEAFGSNRLMFGSDWPVCLLAGSYRQVVELVEAYTKDFTPEEKDKICGVNAQRFYRVKA
jgi:L-fuconolactonase